MRAYNKWVKLFYLQAREYVAEQKKRGQYSRMRAWGVGGESVPSGCGPQDARGKRGPVISLLDLIGDL